MIVYIVTNHNDLISRFGRIKKSGMVELVFVPHQELRKIVKGSNEDVFMYIDVGGMDDDERRKQINYLSRYMKMKYGIIDPFSEIPDQAELFHRGAVDYLGKVMLEKGVSLSRIKKALEYADYIAETRGVGTASRKSGYILSGSNWHRVRAGNEYTFWMMIIELDNLDTLKETLSTSKYKALTKRFRTYIESCVSPEQGKLWIWNERGGLVLFPFDGKGYNPIATTIRLFLRQETFWIEWDFPRIVSYHMALHVGNTIYQPQGKTGTIASDAVNRIFHLGGKYTKSYQFYITHAVYQLLPPRLNSFFIPTGTYESLQLYRLRFDISHKHSSLKYKRKRKTKSPLRSKA